MLRSAIIKKIGFIALAFAMIFSCKTMAATTPVVTAGAVTIGGSPYAGGSIYYQFSLTTTAPGVLVVKSTLSGTGLKAATATFTASNIVAGANVVKSPALAIPAGYTGSVTLKLTATLNKKPVTIAAIAPIAISYQPVAVTVYDAGFGNSVVLNGSLVPTNGMGAAVTYAWTQLANSLGSKAPGTLSATNVANPTLTTGHITNFVNTANSTNTIFVNDIDDVGGTNALYVVPEHRFGKIASISLDNEQITESTYIYRLIVSDSAITRTGSFTVVCAAQTPALQNNSPVGVTIYYKNATNSTSWSLQSQPSASHAVLTHTNDIVAQLLPDVEGSYVIKDNVTGAILTNYAASFAGVTGGAASCENCHSSGGSATNMVSQWQQTKHATMAQRGVDGAFGSHYSEACFVCHTLGYNKASAASNGNFYAVEKNVQPPWTFPAILTNGNYAAMPPALQNKANIQCESCHGPGSLHSGNLAKISVSMDAKVCTQCHQDGSHHVHPQQWEVSPHSGAYEKISIVNGEGFNPTCARCHSPVGYKDAADKLNAGVALASFATNNTLGGGPLVCQSCHNPHDTYGDPNRHQLRTYDTAIIGDPLQPNTITVDAVDAQALLAGNLAQTNSTITLTNASFKASCMTCHNTRRFPTTIQRTGSNAGKPYWQTSTPHESPVAENFLGIGVIDYGKQMGNSFHTYLAECTDCHMYKLRAPSGTTALDSVNVGGVVTKVDAATYARYENVLGDHTFSMTYMDGTNEVQNIAACNQCHASFEPVTSFDFMSETARDYDGDGVISGVQTEVGTGLLSDVNPTHGLLNILADKMQKTGLTFALFTNGVGEVYVNGANTSSFSTNTAVANAQHKAQWNFLMVRRDGSRGVHNTQFTIRLLQSTYTDLSTNAFGNSFTNTFQGQFPNAYLR